MEVIEKNEGLKIPYEIKGKVLAFDETISVNVGKYQKDEQVVIDVCLDKDMQLGFFINQSDVGYNWYVANIVIPPRSYKFVESGRVDDNNSPIYNKVPEALNIDDISLYLWCLPSNYVGGGN